MKEREAMQNWAKRSMRAALVTGGVLAVGTSGVASAEDESEQPTLGDGQLTWDEIRQAGSPFTQPGSTVTRISGTLDSERDLLPAVENDVTREIPAITDDGELRPAGPARTSSRAASAGPRHRLQEPVTAPDAETLVLPRIDAVEPPAGDAAPAEAAPAEAAERSAASRGGQHRREPAQPTERAAATPASAEATPATPATPAAAEARRPLPDGSPARGVYRSMSWTGPIGDVVRGGSSSASTAASGGPVLAEPLITPSEEIVYADGFEDFGRSTRPAGPDAARQPSGAVQQPSGTTGAERATAQPARANPPAGGLLGGLLDPSGQDLTTADLSRATKLHPVPHAVLNKALATTAPRSAAPSEPRTLTVPGEYQDRVDELPGLRGLDRAPRAAAIPEGTAPLRGVVEAALSGTLPSGADGSADAVRFSPDPSRSAVSVTTLDELTAGMPERNWVARNPFPTRKALPAMPDLGMALPTFSAPPNAGAPDAGRPSTGQNDETLVMPGQRA
ncbi:hypothetical protein [Salinifilum aidingensis]